MSEEAPSDAEFLRGIADSTKPRRYVPEIEAKVNRLRRIADEIENRRKIQNLAHRRQQASDALLGLFVKAKPNIPDLHVIVDTVLKAFFREG